MSLGKMFNACVCVCVCVCAHIKCSTLGGNICCFFISRILHICSKLYRSFIGNQCRMWLINSQYPSYPLLVHLPEHLPELRLKSSKLFFFLLPCDCLWRRDTFQIKKQLFDIQKECLRRTSYADCFFWQASHHFGGQFLVDLQAAVEAVIPGS